MSLQANGLLTDMFYISILWKEIRLYHIETQSRSWNIMEPTWQRRRQETEQRDALFSTRHSIASSSSGQRLEKNSSPWRQDGTPRTPGGTPSIDPEIVAQRRMVQRAVQQHKSTTAAAERSLQIAETCLDIGSVTLEEVARQGESLDKTERGMDLVCLFLSA